MTEVEKMDLSNHMLYGAFEEAGYDFKGWQPANDQAVRIMVIQAFKDGELVAERSSPMMYPNLFGVDVADVQAFEEVTDQLIKELTTS